MRKAHEEKDHLQQQYEESKKQVEELKLEAKMREHEIAATRSAVKMMEKEAAEARVSLEGIQSQSADEATQLRAGVLVIQDGMKKSQDTIEGYCYYYQLVQRLGYDDVSTGQAREMSPYTTSPLLLLLLFLAFVSFWMGETASNVSSSCPKKKPQNWSRN